MSSAAGRVRFCWREPKTGLALPLNVIGDKLLIARPFLASHPGGGGGTPIAAMNSPRVISLPPDQSLLPDGTKAGGWWHETDEAGRMVCDLCPRACPLKPGDRGFCFVRQNRGRRDGADDLRPQHRFLHRSDRKEAAESFLSRYQRAVVSARPAATWAASSARTGTSPKLAKSNG